MTMKKKKKKKSEAIKIEKMMMMIIIKLITNFMVNAISDLLLVHQMLI